jgi:hypothetical protein
MSEFGYIGMHGFLDIRSIKISIHVIITAGIEVHQLPHKIIK